MTGASVVSVTFIEADGTRRTIAAPVGEPLMIPARNAGVRGIVAECGGVSDVRNLPLLCGFGSRGGAAAAARPDEVDTIEFNANAPQDNSRLTCQIKVTQALDGAVFAGGDGALGGLSRQNAAVDDKAGASDKIRRSGGQKQHRALNLMRTAQAAHGGIGHGGGRVARAALGLDDAGAQHVHLNVVGRIMQRHFPRQVDNPGL